MFERFTERARQVVTFAQEEARELRHGYIGTEHVLLGLLREEQGLGARVMFLLGLEIEDIRTLVKEHSGYQPNDPIPNGQIPFSPEAKKILENSLREAISLGHNYIGTEHIALGLARSAGAAQVILNKLGVTRDDVRNEVMKVLAGRPRNEDKPEKKVENQEYKYEKVKLDAKELADTILNLREAADKLEMKTQLDRVEQKLDLVIVALGEIRKEKS